MSLRFKGRIDDGFGPLLDNMRVIQAVIPEPATWGDADRRFRPCRHGHAPLPDCRRGLNSLQPIEGALRATAAPFSRQRPKMARKRVKVTAAAASIPAPIAAGSGRPARWAAAKTP